MSHPPAPPESEPMNVLGECVYCDIQASMRAILNTITDGVMVIDGAGIICLLNPAAERLFGYPCSELLGKNISLLMPSPYSEQHDAYLNAYLATGVKKIIGIGREVRGLRKNGSSFPLYLSVGELQEKSQRLFVGILHDLTRQKQAQEALEESEARFRQMADMVGEWLWEQDASGHYIYSSNAVRDILGYRPEEIAGKHYLELLTPENRRYWSEAIPSANGAHSFFRLINRYQHRDGHEIYTESTGTPLFDDYGQVLKWRGVDVDITQRKHYEDALRLRDRAIEAANVGLVIADARKPGFPNIYVNSALCSLTGYTREDLLNRDLRLLQGPDTDPAALAKIRNALQQGAPCEVVMKNYRKDGTPFWNELSISPVHDDAGSLTHFIGVQTDVTERRRAEEERQALEIAKTIQLSLLPKAPMNTHGLRIAGVCLPAGHVGGDYFDYFRHNRHVDVVIADVSGHSVGSALLMADMRSTLRAETRFSLHGRKAPSIAETLGTLNELLYADLSGTELFITMFYLRYDLESHTLTYANAGHNRPLLLRAESPACAHLDADGLVLGVEPEVVFEQKRLTLASGDQVLLYTDGMVETQNEAGEFFGTTRLCAAFFRHRGREPMQIIHDLLMELDEFRGTTEVTDDISMVVIQLD